MERSSAGGRQTGTRNNLWHRQTYFAGVVFAFLLNIGTIPIIRVPVNYLELGRKELKVIYVIAGEYCQNDLRANVTTHCKHIAPVGGGVLQNPTFLFLKCHNHQKIHSLISTTNVACKRWWIRRKHPNNISAIKIKEKRDSKWFLVHLNSDTHRKEILPHRSQYFPNFKYINTRDRFLNKFYKNICCTCNIFTSSGWNRRRESGFHRELSGVHVARSGLQSITVHSLRTLRLRQRYGHLQIRVDDQWRIITYPRTRSISLLEYLEWSHKYDVFCSKWLTCLVQKKKLITDVVSEDRLGHIPVRRIKP